MTRWPQWKNPAGMDNQDTNIGEHDDNDDNDNSNVTSSHYPLHCSARCRYLAPSSRNSWLFCVLTITTTTAATITVPKGKRREYLQQNPINLACPDAGLSTIITRTEPRQERRTLHLEAPASAQPAPSSVFLRQPGLSALQQPQPRFPAHQPGWGIQNF